MKKVLPLSIIALLSLNSCATIFTGTKQTVLFKSEPAGATIEIDGIHRGMTPVELKLRKSFDPSSITLKKEGYEPIYFKPTTNFNVVSILNLFNPLFWAIDGVTGAMMRYDLKIYDLPLKPDAATKAANKEASLQAENQTID